MSVAAVAPMAILSSLNCCGTTNGKGQKTSQICMAIEDAAAISHACRRGYTRVLTTNIYVSAGVGHSWIGRAQAGSSLEPTADWTKHSLKLLSALKSSARAGSQHQIRSLPRIGPACLARVRFLSQGTHAPVRRKPNRSHELTTIVSNRYRSWILRKLIKGG